MKKALIPGAVAALAVLGSAIPSTASVAATKLVGTVGPAHTISLKTSTGKAVKLLKPGAYTIVVRDRADDHDFNLAGPGVRKATSVDGMGTVTWRVKLKAGVYRFWCGPHSDEMRGSFRVR